MRVAGGIGTLRTSSLAVEPGPARGRGGGGGWCEGAELQEWQNIPVSGFDEQNKV